MQFAPSTKQKAEVVFLYRVGIVHLFLVLNMVRIFLTFKSQQLLACEAPDAFPVVASLPQKNSVCEPERQNDFSDVKPLVLM